MTWIAHSTVKLEQIIGDIDWESNAVGIYSPTVSQTVTRFHILGNGLGYSFEDNGHMIFLFGDTISEDTNTYDYHAADPLAWSTNTDGESGLLLNFFTNDPVKHFTPIFVQPYGIEMGPDDIPNAGISLSNGIFLVCNSGSDTSLPSPQTNDFSVLVTFNETNLPLTSSGSFTTNRTISILNTNLDPRSPLQGHFIQVSMHEFGTNVLTFGTGEFRGGDIFLCMTPTAHFVSGAGTLYFTGLTNGQPTWSSAESNCVPVVQDNPTNGPPWPNDFATAGSVSVVYATNLGLWLMTYDGGRNEDSPELHVAGIYFSYARQPWGPWSTPQLIFNAIRDHGYGTFIYNQDPSYNDASLAGPTIGAAHVPATTDGGDFAPMMIERFTRVTNSTLLIYYTMSTWNPYTVVKMRSAFAITPVIDPASLVRTETNFSFGWNSLTNFIYQVDYSTNLRAAWTAFPDVITSTNGTFHFTDHGTNSSGFGNAKYYRLRTTN